MKKILVKGLLLGCTAGLVATFFDSLFLLIPDTYVPASYPFMAGFFNLLFWTMAGGISGLLLWLIAGRRDGFFAREPYYWVIFCLLPGTLLYSIAALKIRGEGCTVDARHYLTIVFVVLFLSSRAVYYWKKITAGSTNPVFFLLELVTIAALFMLGQIITDIHDMLWGTFIQVTSTAFFKYLLLKIIPDDYTLYLMLFRIFAGAAYVAGALILFSLFCALKYVSRKPVTAFIMLMVFSAASLPALFALNRQRFFAVRYPASVIDAQRKVTQPVPAVILIVLDTVRADSVAPDRLPPRMENLDRFFREALVYENCISTSSWTVPAHASLFTGLSPTEHGCHGDPTVKQTGFRTLLCRALPDDFTTLAEVFRKEGYLTAGIIANSLALGPYYNLQQGFDIYDYTKSIGYVYATDIFKPLFTDFCFLTNVKPEYTKYYRTANEVNDSVFYLLSRSAPAPLFLFINYMDAHSPYRPPRPFNGYFLKNPFPHMAGLVKRTLRRFHSLPDQDWYALQRSQYEGEIAYLDQQLGNLFDRLKERGMYDSSLIIITSDHGELFGEHGLEYHQGPLYEGVVRVPLLIKFPFNGRVGREKAMISLADLYPTILSICKLPVPEGISGKAFGRGREIAVAGFRGYKYRTHRALYHGTYKYMKYEKHNPAELYDLEKDPQETINIVAKMPELALRMEQKLTEWVQQHPPRYKASAARPAALKPEVLQGLKALGYVQ